MPHDGVVFDLPAGDSAGGDGPLLIHKIPYRDPVTAFAPWSGQPFAAHAAFRWAPPISQPITADPRVSGMRALPAGVGRCGVE